MQTVTLYLDKGHPNRPGKILSKVTGCVVHWTANETKGADAVANRNYFNRKYRILHNPDTGKLAVYEMENYKDGRPIPFHFASAHLNVDDHQLTENLTWKKGVAEEGYHVGATHYIAGICDKLGTTYPNDSTIGLEICVNADGDFKKAYANGVQVMAMMLKEHGLGIEGLIRHYDVTGKICPAFFVDESYAKKYFGTTAAVAYAKFREDVEKALGGIPVVNNSNPSVLHERVYALNGVLKTVPVQPNGKQDYTVSATDVRFLKLPKGIFTMKLVWSKGKTVSEIVKESGADYGFNFPFFWNGVPVADCKIGSQILNKGYDTAGGAQQTKWHGLAWKHGEPVIGTLNIADDYGSDGFLVKTSPLLIDHSSAVWDYYRGIEGTASDIGMDTNGHYVRAQRTFVGLDAQGNLLVAVGDGRTQYDRGLNLEEMALYMASKGAVVALNGDGGSSAVLADQSGSLGQNKGSGERAVGHAVLIYLKPPAPEPAPTQEYFRLFMGGVQQGAYSTRDNGIIATKALYRAKLDPSIVLNNPDGSPLYTPSKHPADFPELISEEQKLVDSLSSDMQQKVYAILKKKFG